MISQVLPYRFPLPVQQWQSGTPDPPIPPAPPAPAPVPPAPPAPPAPRHVADPLAEVTRLQGEIANVRAEAAAHRVNERTANESVAAANARIAELQTEATRRETAAREAGTAEATTWKDRTMKAEIKAAALAAGLVDVDLVPLIATAGIVVAADGSITGIPEAIAAFKTAKPTYFRDSAAPPQPGAPPAPPRAPGAPAPAPTPGPPQGSVRDLSDTDYKAQKRAVLSGLRRM